MLLEVPHLSNFKSVSEEKDPNSDEERTHQFLFTFDVRSRSVGNSVEKHCCLLTLSVCVCVCLTAIVIIIVVVDCAGLSDSHVQQSKQVKYT